jgi:protein-S-isoprenylcysteine O-methyltransferase Ste14
MTTYTTLAIIFLVCLNIRTGYEMLKERGKVNPGNKLAFAIVFTAMMTLWGTWFVLCPQDPYHIELPGVVQWTGYALFVLGFVLAVGALIQLKALENVDHLVTTGLFARLRHPMYTGFIFWLLGWSTFHGSMASFAIGLLGIANILYWRRLEDVSLERKYGARYAEYRRRSWF